MSKRIDKVRAASLAVLGAATLLFAAGCGASGSDEAANVKESAAGSGAVPATRGDQPHEHSAAEGKAGKQLYQCSMHPNVVSDNPGKCPICGMDLQPVKQIAARGIPGRAPVELTGLQKQLINIRTVPVAEVPFEQTLRSVGRVVVNEKKTATLNSRVMGWVEQLHVDTTGEAVKKGQPLMDVYSPALYSAQQDFLIVHRRDRDSGSGSLLESARKRLELWGVSGEQIRKLEQTGEPTQRLTLTAPVAGTVIEKSVVAAQMVQPGMPLYRIADLSEVWVLAELYESELPFVEVGQKAIVSAPGYPGRTWEGQVDFIYPFLQGKTRTNQMRVVLANPDGLLKPDMYVNVELARDLGTPLSVPASAVFNTGKQQYVFVEQSEGVFVPALVELGPRVGERQAIRSGVQAGAAVVIDGNFLLDSESQLKAVASGTSEAPAAAMTEGDMPKPVALPPAAQSMYAPLVESYLALHEHLANGRFEGVTALSAKLREQLKAIATSGVRPPEQEDAYQQRLQALIQSAESFTPSNLSEARVGFGQLSFDLIALLTQFPPPLAQPLHVFKCPMWEQSPARWIQAEEQIQNPFMGETMPTCGEAVSTIAPAR